MKKEKKISQNKLKYASAISLIILMIFIQAPVRKKASDLFLNRANYYFNGQESQNYNVNKAEKFYKYSLLFNHGNYAAYYQLARIDLVNNNLEEALLKIDKSLVLNPAEKRAFYVRGLANGYLKNFKEAENDFKEFIEFSPREWAGYNDLAWIYYQKEDYAKTKETAERGLKVAPDNPWLLNGAGVAYLGMGQFDKAEELFKKADEKAKDMNAQDYARAYPGNKPSDVQWEFGKFKTNIGSNRSLAFSGSPKGGVFAPACNSVNIGVCVDSNGDTVNDKCQVNGVGTLLCGPDHPSAPNCQVSQCATDSDCYIPVYNGECGPAGTDWVEYIFNSSVILKKYPTDVYDFDGAFCNAGGVLYNGVPLAEPPFPSPGQRVFWQCVGTGPWSPYCAAERDSFVCTDVSGIPPANSSMCTGDNLGLTENTPEILVANCTSGTKCEYTCDSGYTLQGGSCVVALPSCDTTCNCDNVCTGSTCYDGCGDSCGAGTRDCSWQEVAP
ncbi:MAG: tetratricopeptide repeat protein [Patescibacteria group bacterium]